MMEGHKCTLTSEIPLLDTGASQLFQNLSNYTNCNFISRPFFKYIHTYIYIYIYPTNLPYIIKKKEKEKHD